VKRRSIRHDVNLAHFAIHLIITFLFLPPYESCKEPSSDHYHIQVLLMNMYVELQQ